MPSRESETHRRSVEEGARHHASAKTYSGLFLRAHLPFLIELSKRYEIQSALDYGCGKGLQYTWRDPLNGDRTMEEQLGYEIAKFDPCWPAFAAEPKGKFDLVMCTHTLSLIPLADLDWVLDRIFGFATKAVFIAEKIGPRKKKEVSTTLQRPFDWKTSQWLDLLAPFADRAGLPLVFSSRVIVDDQSVTTRFVRQGGETSIWEG